MAVAVAVRRPVTASRAPGRAIGGHPSRKGPTADRPNIVFLLADQLRASSLPAYGERRIETPHTGRLAHVGVLERTVVDRDPARRIRRGRQSVNLSDQVNLGVATAARAGGDRPAALRLARQRTVPT